jgi:hypothetical protein
MAYNGENRIALSPTQPWSCASPNLVVYSGAGSQGSLYCVFADLQTNRIRILKRGIRSATSELGATTLNLFTEHEEFANSTKAFQPFCYDGKLKIAFTDDANGVSTIDYEDGGEFINCHRILGAKSDASPAATQIGPLLVVAYKGNGSESIYYAFTGGSDWLGDQKLVGDQQDYLTSASPTMACDGHSTILAYAGPSNNGASNLFVAYSSVQRWPIKGWSMASVLQFHDMGSATNVTPRIVGDPSVTILNGSAYIAYRSADFPSSMFLVSARIPADPTNPSQWEWQAVNEAGMWVEVPVSDVTYQDRNMMSPNTPMAWQFGSYLVIGYRRVSSDISNDWMSIALVPSFD